MRLAACVFFLGLGAPPALADPVACLISGITTCHPNQPCSFSKEIGATRTIDLDRKAYSRCDDKGACDAIPVIVTLTGGVMTVDAPGRGLFAKLAADGAFSEAASVGVTVVVSQGRCAKVER